jgi:hypothetical protein
MGFWQTVFTSFGSSAVLTAILVFLLREWLSTRIRKSIEHEYATKEARLKAELDGEFAGVQAGYQKILNENQIRFSRLHADQAEAAKVLYRHIHKTHSTIGTMVSVLQQGVPIDPEQRKAFFDEQEQEARDAFNACSALLP